MADVTVVSMAALMELVKVVPRECALAAQKD
jgi:hypothetical protein